MLRKPLVVVVVLTWSLPESITSYSVHYFRATSGDRHRLETSVGTSFIGTGALLVVNGPT